MVRRAGRSDSRPRQGSMGTIKRARPTDVIYKEFWERTDESVHALAERVGRATVWVWRKADGGHIEITDEHTNIAEKCVRVFPAM